MSSPPPPKPSGAENQQIPQHQVIQPGQQQMYVVGPGGQMQQGQQQMYVVGPGGQMQPGQQQMYIAGPGGQMPPGQQPMYMAGPGGQMPPGSIPMQQMQQTNMMARPQMIPNCPPGLEYLTQLDQLLVKQKIEMLEVFTNVEMKNRYVVKNALGQQVYFAEEESDCLTRQCCGARRPFTLNISDNMGQQVIQLERPFKWMCMGQCCSCSECCQDEVEVQAPPGETIGYVKQLYEGCDIGYAIQDRDRNMALRIKGPSYFHCYCPGDDVPMSLTSPDGEHEVGRVSKQWSNLMREYFTDADNFGIQFPMDLDVRMKAVILGAVFLIDFMYFEQQRRHH